MPSDRADVGGGWRNLPLLGQIHLAEERVCSANARCREMQPLLVSGRLTG